MNLSWDRLQKVDAHLSRAILEAKCLDGQESVTELGKIVAELDNQRDRCLQAMSSKSSDIEHLPILENNVYGGVHSSDWVDYVVSRLRMPRGPAMVSCSEELGRFTIELPSFLVQINQPCLPGLVNVLIIDEDKHRFYSLVDVVNYYEAALVKAGM